MSSLKIFHFPDLYNIADVNILVTLHSPFKAEKWVKALLYGEIRRIGYNRRALLSFLTSFKSFTIIGIQTTKI